MAKGKPPRGAISPLQFFSKLVWLDGRPLLDVIEPYRRRIFDEVLWTFDADGRPKINMALTGRSKKCWKTTDLVLAGLFRFTVWPSQWGNSSAIVASDLDQANDDLSLCKKLIDRNPILSNAIEVRVKQIIRKDTGDTLDILPAQDADGLHGKTYCFLGEDEIHVWNDYRICEALSQDPLRLDTLTWMRKRCWRSVRRRPRQNGLIETMGDLGYQAHGLGDASAKKRISELSKEATTIDHELVALNAAQVEASRRLAAARRNTDSRSSAPRPMMRSLRFRYCGKRARPRPRG
jgi:hypothetical protein